MLLLTLLAFKQCDDVHMSSIWRGCEMLLLLLQLLWSHSLCMR
jgi:hypothetical protein